MKKWQSKNKSKNNLKLKPAFTLAEVLITLAIIGVVASLTIQTLVQNYQKHQYVTALKKNYNILQNGFKGYMAQEGVTKLSDTKLWMKFGTYSEITYYNYNAEKQKNFFNELARIFSIINYDTSSIKYQYLTSSEYSAMSGGFMLRDGTIIYHDFYKNPQATTYSIGKNMPNHLGKLAIDVNGAKKPNRWGRDLFYFALFDDGSLHSIGSSFYSTFKSGDPLAKDYYWKNAGTAGCKMKSTNYRNEGCGARIMEEGWKMDY